MIPTLVALASLALPARMPDVVTLTAVLEQDGAPVDRAVSVELSLWDGPVDGDAVWVDDPRGVLVMDGVLVAELGANRPLPARVFAEPRWLEIVVDGQTLDPRVRVSSAPHALEAARAAEADWADEAGECASAAAATTAETLNGMSADDFVTHAELDDYGRRAVFLRAPGCGGGLDVGAACMTTPCVDGAGKPGDPRFNDCAGICRLATSVACPLPAVGWMFADP